MDKFLVIIVVTAVLLGWLSHSLLNVVAFETPYAFTRAQEQLSPGDHLSEDQIKVYDDYAVIYAKNLIWARFTDTNSMDPLLDATANSLEIKPKTPADIHVGDIISYTFEGSLILHRVIRIDGDEQGWYAVAKGDNNPDPDPEKVRFSQIHGIVVGILY